MNDNYNVNCFFDFHDFTRKVFTRTLSKGKPDKIVISVNWAHKPMLIFNYTASLIYSGEGFNISGKYFDGNIDLADSVESFNAFYKQVVQKYFNELNKNCLIEYDCYSLGICCSCGYIHRINLSDRYCPECSKFKDDLSRTITQKIERFKTEILKLGFLPEYTLEQFRFDFFKPNLNLALEIDDISHKFKIDHDNKRDRHFLRRGIKTVRFTNKEIEDNLADCVLEVKTLIDTAQISDN